MLEVFMDTFRPGPGTTVLDVGATSDDSYESSNYLEMLYPYRAQITACGMDDASHLETKYPGVKFVRANGLALPFGNCSFDLVHSSAVLEHVGSASNQMRFVQECARVAARGFLLTTPNRWFPVDYHTLLPLLHWLPKERHRSLLRAMGYDFFAKEENLNLLTASDLSSIGREVSGFDTRVIAVKLLGWPSNLLMVGHRSADYKKPGESNNAGLKQQ
jgi:hypothetical protein